MESNRHLLVRVDDFPADHPLRQRRGFFASPLRNSSSLLPLSVRGVNPVKASVIHPYHSGRSRGSGRFSCCFFFLFGFCFFHLLSDSFRDKVDYILNPHSASSF